MIGRNLSSFSTSRRSPRVVVVGCGLTGAHVALKLAEMRLGNNVIVIDKGRGPGGRCATRRIEDLSFDTGMQMYRVRDEDFSGVHGGWLEKGLVKPWADGLCSPGMVKNLTEWSKNWQSKEHDTNGYLWPTDEKGLELVGKLDPNPRFSFTNHATSLVKDIVGRLKDVEFRFGVEIDSINADKGWKLKTTTGEVIPADFLVMTSPMPQTLRLLERGKQPRPLDSFIKSSLEQVTYYPSVLFLLPIDINPTGNARNLTINVQDLDFPINFLQIQKGGLLVRMSNEWSARYYNESWNVKDAIEHAKPILSKVCTLLGVSMPDTIQDNQVKTWKFANVSNGVTGRRFFFADMGSVKGHVRPLPIMFGGDAFTKELPKGGQSSEWIDAGLGVQRAVISGLDIGTTVHGLLPAIVKSLR